MDEFKVIEIPLPTYEECITNEINPPTYDESVKNVQRNEDTLSCIYLDAIDKFRSPA